MLVGPGAVLSTDVMEGVGTGGEEEGMAETPDGPLVVTTDVMEGVGTGGEEEGMAETPDVVTTDVMEEGEEEEEEEEEEGGMELNRAEEGMELNRDDEGMELERAEEGLKLNRAEEGMELNRAEEGMELERAEEGLERSISVGAGDVKKVPVTCAVSTVLGEMDVMVVAMEVKGGEVEEGSGISVEEERGEELTIPAAERQKAYIDMYYVNTSNNRAKQAKDTGQFLFVQPTNIN